MSILAPTTDHERVTLVHRLVMTPAAHEHLAQLDPRERGRLVEAALTSERFLIDFAEAPAVLLARSRAEGARMIDENLAAAATAPQEAPEPQVAAEVPEAAPESLSVAPAAREAVASLGDSGLAVRITADPTPEAPDREHVTNRDGAHVGYLFHTDAGKVIASTSLAHRVLFRDEASALTYLARQARRA
jgi:hypothetical protein